MDPITSKILDLVLDQAAARLMEELDATRARLKDIDDKVDALLFGGMRTATRELHEAGRLSASEARRSKLDHATRLFAEAEGQVAHYLDRKRGSLDVPVAKFAAMAYMDPHPITVELLVLETLNQHVPSEQAWLFARLGALRTAIEVGDAKVVELKQEAMREAIAESSGFLRAKRDELNAGIVAAYRGKLGKAQLVLAKTNPLGWAGLAWRKLGDRDLQLVHARAELESFFATWERVGADLAACGPAPQPSSA